LQDSEKTLLKAMIAKSVIDGYDTRDKVKMRLRNIDPSLVDTAIDEMLREGSLREVEGGFLFFRSKRLVVTERGLSVLRRGVELVRDMKSGKAGVDIAGSVIASTAMVLLAALLLSDLMDDAAHEWHDSGEPEYPEEEIGDFELDVEL